jgi:hypothetical protein
MEGKANLAPEPGKGQKERNSGKEQDGIQVLLSQG